jgi:hypothetical protein
VQSYSPHLFAALGAGRSLLETLRRWGNRFSSEATLKKGSCIRASRVVGWVAAGRYFKMKLVLGTLSVVAQRGYVLHYSIKMIILRYEMGMDTSQLRSVVGSITIGCRAALALATRSANGHTC